MIEFGMALEIMFEVIVGYAIVLSCALFISDIIFTLIDYNKIKKLIKRTRGENIGENKIRNDN